MIVSINGMDNSGKTTQCNELITKYPDLFIEKYHIKDMPSFDKQKYNFKWWFSMDNGEEFVNVIYKCLEERNCLALSKNQQDTIIIFDKGNDFYEKRIIATLIAKGYSYEDAVILNNKIRKNYQIDDIETIKFFLTLDQSHEKSMNDFEENKRQIYNMYLEINKILLMNSINIYSLINKGSVEDVTNTIINRINYIRNLQNNLNDIMRKRKI